MQKEMVPINYANSISVTILSENKSHVVPAKTLHSVGSFAVVTDQILLVQGSPHKVQLLHLIILPSLSDCCTRKKHTLRAPVYREVQLMNDPMLKLYMSLSVAIEAPLAHSETPLNWPPWKFTRVGFRFYFRSHGMAWCDTVFVCGSGRAPPPHH